MGKRRGRSNAAPEVAPLDVDGVRTVAVVTVLWAVAVVVLVFFREQLVDDGRGWWLWTGLAGVGFGLLALEYTRKRRDAYLEATGAEEPEEFESDEPASGASMSEAAAPEMTAPEVEASGKQLSSAAHAQAPVPEPVAPQEAHPQAAPSPDPEDYRRTGPIAAEPPAHEVAEETTGHGGRRRARRGRRAADVETSPGSRADEEFSNGPVTDPGTNPGLSPRSPVPGAASSAPTASPFGSTEPETGDREITSDHETAGDHGSGDRHTTGRHAVPAPEFDTDVRAWLDLSEDDHPVTNHDTMSTRPIPPMRPQVSPEQDASGATETRSASTSSDTGELPPSTPRSAPHPGRARGATSQDVLAERHSQGIAPARDVQGSDPARDPLGSDSAQDLPAGESSPRARERQDAAQPGPRSRPASIDSEFFDAVGPVTSSAARSEGYDPDAPLLGDTLNRRQPSSEQVDDTAEEELDAGSTGTEGPYRGRRARRPGSY